MRKIFVNRYFLTVLTFIIFFVFTNLISVFLTELSINRKILWLYLIAYFAWLSVPFYIYYRFFKHNKNIIIYVSLIWFITALYLILSTVPGIIGSTTMSDPMNIEEFPDFEKWYQDKYG